MSRPGRALLGLALWTGGLLLLGRGAIRFVVGHHERGEDAGVVLWRLADELGRSASHALACGAAAAALGFWAARARKLAALGCALLVAALLLSVLSGWPVDDAYYVPRWTSERGRLALYVLAPLALCGGAALLLLARADATRRLLGSTPVLALGAALALVAPLVFALTFTRLPPTRTVRIRVHEVAFEPELWRATRQREDAPVSLGVVTPSLDYRVDGGDLPALVMPPPAEVRFRVPAEPEGLFLRASAGVDHRSQRRLAREGRAVRVGFEIEVDGRRVLDQELLLGPNFEGELAWQRLPARGARVAAGSEVVLRTRIEQRDAGDAASVRLGFGELVLEREVERPRATSSPETPNVLLIVMDTLRADRMSLYGYASPTTPHLDALGARGLVFDEAYATSSWTWPATASILTGLIPEAHQVTSDGSCYLDGKITTLAEVLGERGYTTAAFTCNPLIVPDKNFDQGFELFDSAPTFRKTSLVMERVSAWLRMHRRDRFFLYLHLVDPHWSYEPSPEARALFGLGEPPPGFPPNGIADYHSMLLRGKGHGPSGELLTDELVPASHREHMDREYDAAVFTADQFVGRILELLASLGLEERTIVVFTSDHGEEILDHGLVTHGVSLHPELTRAPLILAGPGIPIGRSATRVSNRHLAPTLAAFAGAEMPTRSGDPGAPDPAFGPLGPLVLYDPAAIPEEPILFSTHQGWWKGRPQMEIYGMIEGEWEVHYAPKGRPWGQADTGPPGDFKLFHLPSDPGHQRDLARERPAEARALVDRMLEHHARARSVGRAVRLGVGSGSERMLRDIGYIGAGGDGRPRDPAAAEDPPR